MGRRRGGWRQKHGSCLKETGVTICRGGARCFNRSWHWSCVIIEWRCRRALSAWEGGMQHLSRSHLGKCLGKMMQQADVTCNIGTGPHDTTEHIVFSYILEPLRRSANGNVPDEHPTDQQSTDKQIQVCNGRHRGLMRDRPSRWLHWKSSRIKHGNADPQSLQDGGEHPGAFHGTRAKRLKEALSSVVSRCISPSWDGKVTDQA